MSKSSYRKITIDGEEWRWKVGSSFVSIRGPNKEHYIVGKDDITGVEDVERAEWKGYFHISPKHIRAYILMKSGKLDILSKLKDVFYGKEYVEYVGGTLGIVVDKELCLLNIGDGNTEEEKIWIALNYLKYKNPGHIFYDAAIKIASQNHQYRKLVAIAMLKSFELSV